MDLDKDMDVEYKDVENMNVEYKDVQNMDVENMEFTKRYNLRKRCNSKRWINEAV